MASWLASTGSTDQGRVVDISLSQGFCGADFLRNFQRVGLGDQGIGTHSMISKYILDHRQSRLPLTLFLQMLPTCQVVTGQLVVTISINSLPTPKAGGCASGTNASEIVQNIATVTGLNGMGG